MKKIVFSFCTIALLAGTALRAEVPSLSASSKTDLKDAPAAVQNAIKTQAGAAQIEDLEKGTLNGRTVYEAAFKKAGQHTELRVAEDGTIVDTIVAGVSQNSGTQTASTTPASTTSAATTASAATAADAAGAYEAGFDVKLSGASKVTLDQVPANVQKIIKEHAGSAKIEDIDKGRIGHTGLIGYEAAYKKNGKNTELRVAESGSVVQEVIAGVPTFWYLKSPGFHTPITNAKVIPLEQLPAHIQSSIKSRIGTGQTPRVLLGTIEGKKMYQVSYIQNNQVGYLRLGKNGDIERQVFNGKVINESAGAKK